MKITFDNYKDIIDEKDQSLMNNLLIDLENFNSLLTDQGEKYRHIYFDIEKEHTQYSPERTEPCPDYYGLYRIRYVNNEYESIGDYMTIDELDSAMLILFNFVESKLS